MIERAEIQSFWQHLPRVLHYPLHPENLVVIGILGFLGFLGQAFILLAIPAWIASFGYAFGVLAHTARGHLQPRSGYFDLVSSSVVWKQQMLWLLMVGAVVLAWRWLGPLAGLPLALLLGAGLPVATMSLALDQNLGSALNPVTWLKAARPMGSRYLLLLALLTGFVLAGWIALQLLVHLGVAGSLIYELLIRYLLIAAFYLLGYVLYQYHEHYHLDIDPVAEIIAERTAGPAPDPALERSDALIAAGDPVGARQVLRQALDVQGALSPLAEPYVRLCASMGDLESELDLFRQQLVILLANEDWDRATSVIRQATELEREFLLANPDDILPFAKHLFAAGQSELALQLSQHFDRRYPGHRDRIGNGYLSAQILSEKLGRDAEALALLAALEKDFASHPQIDVVRRYRETVTRRLAGHPDD